MREGHFVEGTAIISRRDLMSFNIDHFCRPTYLYTNGQAIVSLVRRNQDRFENPAYTEYDASAGVAKDAWSAELYALNLTNVIKSQFTSDAQFTLQETINRPRVLGLRVGYKF